MAEVMFTDEEASRCLIGQDAFEHGKLLREIAKLNQQLTETIRVATTELEQQKEYYEEQLHSDDAKVELAIERGMVRREKEWTEERWALKRQLKKAVDKTNEAIQERDHVTRMLEDANTSPDKLVVSLNNAKMMILIMERLADGSYQPLPASYQMNNNLRVAIRAWATNNLGYDLGSMSATEYDNLVKMMFAHIRDIFQPHTNKVGAWAKDADPTIHPFKGIVEATPVVDETNGDTTNEGSK